MATKPAQTQVCPETDREKIARIIDPAAFENWHRYYLQRKNADMLEPIVASQAAHYQYGDDIKSAYALADAVLAALPILPSGQEVLCACSDACAKDSEIERLRTAMQEACDLLAERKRGHSARSPGHNARLCLQSALKPLPAPPSIEKSGGEK